MEEFLEKSSGI